MKRKSEKGPKKNLYTEEREIPWRGPHEEAEIQRKVLRRGKNLAFSENTCIDKERVRSKVIPRKVGVELKRRPEPSRRRLDWRLAWWVSTEKKEASQISRIERKAPVLRPALQSKQNSLCGFYRSGDQGRGGPNGQIVSIKRAADGRRQRSREIINEERKKNRTKNGSLRNTSTDSKGTTCVILINHKTTRLSERKD